MAKNCPIMELIKVKFNYDNRKASREMFEKIPIKARKPDRPRKYPKR